VQAHAAILVGADEFGGVDHPTLQRREDLATGQQAYGHAQLAVDLAGQAGDAHLQALEAVDVLQGLAEPAGHLRAGIAHGHRHQAVRLVQLLPKLEAATVVQPGVHALGVHTEGHGGEELCGGDLAGPEEGVGGVHLDHAAGHRIEALQRRNQLAGGEVLDLQAPAGHFLHALAEVGRAARALHVEGRAGRIGVGHLPVEGLAADRGTGYAAGTQCQACAGCEGARADEVASIERHGRSPGSWPWQQAVPAGCKVAADCHQQLPCQEKTIFKLLIYNGFIFISGFRKNGQTHKKQARRQGRS